MQTDIEVTLPAQDNLYLPSGVIPIASKGIRLPGEARPIRRQATREIGGAIEKLGHAVEYLIDSRMFLTQVPYTLAEEEAVKILMRLNRLVFESCPEVLPIHQRLGRRLTGLLRWRPGLREQV